MTVLVIIKVVKNSFSSVIATTHTEKGWPPGLLHLQIMTIFMAEGARLVSEG